MQECPDQADPAQQCRTRASSSAGVPVWAWGGPDRPWLHCPIDRSATRPHHESGAEAGTIHAAATAAATPDIRLPQNLPPLPTPTTATHRTEPLLATHHTHDCNRQHAGQPAFSIALARILRKQVATLPRPVRPAAARAAIAPLQHTHHHSKLHLSVFIF